MQICLLGGVRIIGADGAPIDPGPAKCQELLAALAVDADTAVPVSTLIELLWRDNPPRTAEKTLQTYVARLRKSIGHDAIARVGNAYRLEMPADSIDVNRFRRHLAQGDTRGALDEWVGLPLAGLDAEGLAPVVDGLIEEWLAAIEADLEHTVNRDPLAAVGTLTQLTASHPFREGLWALLMTALYKVGRQAEALDAFRKARTHLVEELGVEPGPRLRELESLILTQDEQLGTGHRRPASAGAIPTGTITFGFCDVQGSTQMWATQHDKTSTAIVRYEELVRLAVADNDGFVFATGGDSFGVAFHRVRDAASWADQLHLALAEEPWADGAEITIRIGLHTGDAEERDDNFYGPSVNLASRIAAAGHGGQTLLSEATAALLDSVDLVDLGAHRFDGIATEQHVQQLGTGEFPPLRTVSDRVGNLPQTTDRLIGRATILSAITDELLTSPIVTLVGPGGIGKTRLALEAGRVAGATYPGGVWFVELAAVSASADVARAVADSLEVQETSGRSVMMAIAGFLDERDALLVLDNCEHVIDGAADLARSVTEACAGLTLLATSREGLGLAGEQLIAIGPLDAESAGVELFNVRASAADRSFDAVASHGSVEEICRRLDGVPLAIELAAARVRSHSPADLVERLGDSFRLLTGGRRTSVERHRTLRATVQWSYDLLSPAEQRLFRRLSIFSGSFDLRAAEIVASDDELDIVDVSGLVGDLVERSMVTVESGRSGRRFRLLETMRQFGAEHLADAGKSNALGRQHAHYVVAEVDRIGKLLAGPAEFDGASDLVELWPNLRAAVDWAITSGEVGLTTRLIGPIATQAFVRRGVGELVDWVERLLAITDPDDSATIELGLLWASLHHAMTQDRAAFARLVERYGAPDMVLANFARVIMDDDEGEIVSTAEEAIAEVRARGEEHVAGLFEIFKGGNLLGAGRMDEAETYIAGLLERFRRSAPPTYVNWALFMLASIAAIKGDVERAEELYEESISVAVPPRTNSPNETLEARFAFRRGDHRRAFTLLRSYVEELLEVGNMSGVGLISIEFINMLIATDRLREAGTVAGYLDTSGMLDVEGPGFKTLLRDSLATIEADSVATDARIEAAGRSLEAHDGMKMIRNLLDGLLDENDSLDRDTTA